MQTFPSEHFVRVALAAVGQHGCPAAPQPLQAPIEHVPSVAPQLFVAPAHIPARQHPPPSQRSPPQQGWSAPPHATHTFPRHTPDWQTEPGQQGSVTSPHDTHPVCVHSESAVAHDFPGSWPPQQRLPTEPHSEQSPSVQVPPVVPHAPGLPTHRSL